MHTCRIFKHKQALIDALESFPFIKPGAYCKVDGVKKFRFSGITGSITELDTERVIKRRGHYLLDDGTRLSVRGKALDLGHVVKRNGEQQATSLQQVDTALGICEYSYNQVIYRQVGGNALEFQPPADRLLLEYVIVGFHFWLDVVRPDSLGTVSP